MVKRQGSDSIELTNHISIECRPCSWRKLRGATYIGIVCDEVSFWYSDESYANPDSEVLAAVKPGLLTTHGPLILAPSAYAKHGVLYETWRQHYGQQDSDTLVAYGTSRDLNPTLSQSEIDAEVRKDPARNQAEYLSIWRSDVTSYVDPTVVRACVSLNIVERQPKANLSYTAFCDPSLGAQDSMVVAIGHYEAARQVAVVDAVREAIPPFSPEAVSEEFAQLLKTYRIALITGDKVGGSWVAEQFGKFAIHYSPAAQPKTLLYQDCLAMLNSRRVDLLDHERTIVQFCNLERTSGRGGARDVIDHRRGMHDDLANAVSGLISLLIVRPKLNRDAFVRDADDAGDAVAERRRQVSEYWQGLSNHIFSTTGQWVR
jgi:hypothetical protein